VPASAARHTAEAVEEVAVDPPAAAAEVEAVAAVAAAAAVAVAAAAGAAAAGAAAAVVADPASDQPEVSDHAGGNHHDQRVDLGEDEDRRAQPRQRVGAPVVDDFAGASTGITAFSLLSGERCARRDVPVMGPQQR
jgi:hypothetical protein